MSIERLLKSVFHGDLSAAPALRIELTRGGEDVSALLLRALQHGPEALARLTVALEATDALVQLAAGDWDVQSWGRLGQLALGMGVVIDADQCARLEQIIKAANHRQRNRKLTPAHLLRAMADARYGAHGIGFEHAGESSGTSGVALAVTHARGDKITVGGVNGPPGKPHPRRAWSELKPWSNDWSRNTKSAQAWASTRSPDRLVLNTAPLPTFGEDVVVPEDPVADLLQARTRQAFGKLVTRVNKAKGTAQKALLERLRLGLQDWPDDVRVAGLPWLKALVRAVPKQTWKPGWTLYRHLDLKGFAALDGLHVDGLLASPFVDQLTTLSLHDKGERPQGTAVDDDVFVQLLCTPAWPSLEALHLDLTWDAPLIASVEAAPVISRIKHLTLGAGNYDAPCLRLPHIVEKCAALESLHMDGMAVYADRTEYASALSGALGTLRQLRAFQASVNISESALAAVLGSPTIDGLHVLRLDLMSMVERGSVAPLRRHRLEKLQHLEVRNVAQSLKLVSLLADLPLDEVRHLRFHGHPDTRMHALAGSPLINGLEVLWLDKVWDGVPELLSNSDLSRLTTLHVGEAFGKMLTAVQRLVRGGTVTHLALVNAIAPKDVLKCLRDLQDTQLESLDLSHTRLKGLEHVAESLPGGLRRLVLKRCQLTEPALRGLQALPRFQGTEVVT